MATTNNTHWKFQIIDTINLNAKYKFHYCLFHVFIISMCLLDGWLVRMRCARLTWRMIAMNIFGCPSFSCVLSSSLNCSYSKYTHSKTKNVKAILICILSQCRCHTRHSFNCRFRLCRWTCIKLLHKRHQIWILKHSKPFKYSTNIKYSLRNHNFNVELFFYTALWSTLALGQNVFNRISKTTRMAEQLATSPTRLFAMCACER